MIQWLVQSTVDCPDSQVDASPTWLSPVESAHLARLHIPKRRRDWLLGRWTAKRLLQYYLWQAHGVRWPLDRLAVLNDADGAPCALLERSPAAVLALSLSISHSRDHAFCAFYVPQGRAMDPYGEESPFPIEGSRSLSIGADIEFVEARDPALFAQFFTATEIAGLAALPPETHALCATAIWSLKESVLKALRLGLRADTRCVECCLPPSVLPSPTWNPCAISVHRSLLDVRTVGISAWWRPHENFVLSLAAQETLI